jgi:hypothetical protein
MLTCPGSHLQNLQSLLRQHLVQDGQNGILVSLGSRCDPFCICT